MRLFAKKCLGIDIGASSIKIVEVAAAGKKNRLENYAEFKLPSDQGVVQTFQKESLLLLSDKVAEILQAVLKKANIKQKKVALSIPDFSTFFTTFSLPPMSESEIQQAVEFEARHHVPLPLSEVTFDWQIIEKEEILSGVKLKVLLVVVPNKVLESYQRMATLSQLTVKGIEAEVFALLRSCIPQDKAQLPLCLVDIGWQSTTVSIVENRRLKTSQSFDLSGTSLTRSLTKELNLSLEEAEALKKECGLDPKREDVSRVLTEEIDALALEIERICSDFQQTENKKIDDLVLAGGTASLFGLKEYLATVLKKNIQIADPFSNLEFPPVLGNRLKELGPSFAVALGVGMMGAGL